MSRALSPAELPCQDRRRQDAEVHHRLHPGRGQAAHRHLLHQLRHHPDAGHGGEPAAVHRHRLRAGRDLPGAHRPERVRPAGRAHRAERKAGGQAGGPHDQRGEGEGHRVPQRHRGLPHHQVRGTGVQVLRYLQVHALQLYGGGQGGKGAGVASSGAGPAEAPARFFMLTPQAWRPGPGAAAG